MPTYEYACSSCNHEWEQEQRIVEPPIQVCPACQKNTAKRLVSAGNFILKGGGWYADLYSKPAKGGDKASSSSSHHASSSSSGSAAPSTTSTSSEPSKSEPKPSPTTPPAATPHS